MVLVEGKRTRPNVPFPLVIVWWVLSMGPHCVVKRPAELARRVQELAAGVMARYEKTSRKSAKKAGKAAGW